MKHVILGAAALLAFGMASAPASAQTMQSCAAKYQAAKAANSLGGQSWLQYLASCRKAGATTPTAGVVAAAPTTAAGTTAVGTTAVRTTATRTRSTTTTAPGTPRTPTANQLAERTRQKQCGTQWKAAKAANQIPAGQTWPQYWSACSKRMKGNA